MGRSTQVAGEPVGEIAKLAKDLGRRAAELRPGDQTGVLSLR
jgi:hypothetical protein